MNDYLILTILFAEIIIQLTIIAILFFLFWHQIITKGAPYVPIPKEVLPKINETMQIKEGDVVYDLGSGDGRVIFYLFESEPKAKYVGIDISPWPYLTAKFKKEKKYPDSNITFLREDVFNRDLSDATHIFIPSLINLFRLF